MTLDLIYQLHNLTQIYENRTILAVDALEIFSGEILGIVGPSGAGKSTLLRLLNFLESPFSGEIVYKGITVNGAGVQLDLRREITTVFQQPILLNRSVRDNVAFGLKLRRRRHVKEVVAAALQQVGLQDMVAASARTLSGGEVQRVALARALVIEPKVLLLDEPTANLDPYNVKLIEEIVRQLNEAGTTIVLVTHNIFQAKRLAHRIAFLLEGRLVEVATSEDFYNDPQDPRTQAFVTGDMVY